MLRVPVENFPSVLIGRGGPSKLSQGGAFVGIIGDGVAFLYVSWEAADVWHEHARLARYVGTDIPGATGGAQRGAGDFGDMRYPVFLGLGLRLDAAEPFFAKIPDTIGHPFDVLLDRRQHISEHRGAAGSRDRKEVGEARDAKAQIRLRGALAPLFLERLAAGATDVDLQQRPRHRIKAGSEDDHVDRVFLTLLSDDGRLDRLDRSTVDVDQ